MPAQPRLSKQFISLLLISAARLAEPAQPRLSKHFVCLLLVSAARLSETASKKACDSGLTGDCNYQTCGNFCEESKAKNNCKFCKCQKCEFCPAGGGGPRITSRTPASKSSSASVASEHATLMSSKPDCGARSTGRSWCTYCSSGWSRARSFDGS
jgi:hypothetical protein